MRWPGWLPPRPPAGPPFGLPPSGPVRSLPSRPAALPIPLSPPPTAEASGSLPPMKRNPAGPRPGAAPGRNSTTWIRRSRSPMLRTKEPKAPWQGRSPQSECDSCLPLGTERETRLIRSTCVEPQEPHFQELISCSRCRAFKEKRPSHRASPPDVVTKARPTCDLHSGLFWNPVSVNKNRSIQAENPDVPRGHCKQRVDKSAQFASFLPLTLSYQRKKLCRIRNLPSAACATTPANKSTIAP
jgi:hypothetical protein